MPSPGSTFQLSNWPIQVLPGLTGEDQHLLLAEGVRSTFDLFRATRTRADCDRLARHLNLRQEYLYKWAALANLSRLPSVGCQYCGLLVHCGILNVAQLAGATTAKLHRQILRLHVTLVQRNDLGPTLETIQRWIAEAGWVLRAEAKQQR
jgi:hypothetical protein